MDTFGPPTPTPHLPLARLGLPTAPADAVAAVRAGLPVAAFEGLARALRVPEARLAQVVGLSATTLGRRKRAGALAPDEGDRVWRVAALFDRAASTYDDVGDEFFSTFGRHLVERSGIGAGDCAIARPIPAPA